MSNRNPIIIMGLSRYNWWSWSPSNEYSDVQNLYQRDLGGMLYPSITTLTYCFSDSF